MTSASSVFCTDTGHNNTSSAVARCCSYTVSQPCRGLPGAVPVLLSRSLAASRPVSVSVSVRRTTRHKPVDSSHHRHNSSAFRSISVCRPVFVQLRRTNSVSITVNTSCSRPAVLSLPSPLLGKAAFVPGSLYLTRHRRSARVSRELIGGASLTDYVARILHVQRDYPLLLGILSVSTTTANDGKHNTIGNTIKFDVMLKVHTSRDQKIKKYIQKEQKQDR